MAAVGGTQETGVSNGCNGCDEDAHDGHHDRNVGAGTTGD